MEHQGTPAQQPEYERGMIQVNQHGKTPDRMKRDEWSEGAVETLLDAYESKWVLRNRAKLKGNDWEEVARHVCARSGGSKPLKTQSQCKNKIEALKKRYRSEATSIGGSTSTWGFFTRMDVLLRCPTTGYAPRTGELGTMGATQQQQQHKETMLPQVDSGESERVVKMVNPQQITPEFARRVPQLPNGLNASQHFHHLNRQHQHHHHHSHHQPEQNQHHPCQQQQQQELQESSQEEEDASNTLPQAQPMKRKEEQLGPDSVTSTPRSKIAHAMEGSGKTNAAGVGAAAAVAAAAAAANAAAKRRKVSSSSSEVAESIRSFADSILKLEHAKMEMFRDSERLRADAEARRVEMELKRTEIIAKTQLEIAKLLSRKPIKRKVPHKQSTSALNASITNGNTSTRPPSLNGAPAAGGRSMMDG